MPPLKVVSSMLFAQLKMGKDRAGEVAVTV